MLASMASPVAIGVALLCISFRTQANAQGRSEGGRLPVKRGTDPGAGSVAMHPQRTTVEEILKAQRPADLAGDLSTPAYQNKRISPLETTVWTVKAKITEIVLRPDGDFYMVIQGDTGARTVIELPDPKLCTGSKFIKQITLTRKKLDVMFHPTAQPQKVDYTAELTGVGFFGYGRAARGTTGPVSNGARLMPLLDIKIVH